MHIKVLEYIYFFKFYFQRIYGLLLCSLYLRFCLFFYSLLFSLSVYSTCPRDFCVFTFRLLIWKLIANKRAVRLFIEVHPGSAMASLYRSPFCHWFPHVLSENTILILSLSIYSSNFFFCIQLQTAESMSIKAPVLF